MKRLITLVLAILLVLISIGVYADTFAIQDLSVTRHTGNKPQYDLLQWNQDWTLTYPHTGAVKVLVTIHYHDDTSGADTVFSDADLQDIAPYYGTGSADNVTYQAYPQGNGTGEAFVFYYAPIGPLWGNTDNCRAQWYYTVEGIANGIVADSMSDSYGSNYYYQGTKDPQLEDTYE